MKSGPDEKLYPFVMAAFAVILVLSNTVASKVWSVGGFVFAGAMIIFPVSYILGDVLTEVYGFARARKVIWVGIASNVLMVVVYMIVSALPGVDPEFSTAFSTVLSPVLRVVVASMAGLWCGQFVNSIVLSRLKVATNGRWLWVRTIASTLLGEGIDTAVFVTIAFAGTLPWTVIVNMILTGAAVKTLYEAAITPVTYVVVRWFKRVEGGEAYDDEVAYNPFSVGAL